MPRIWDAVRKERKRRKDGKTLIKQRMEEEGAGKKNEK